MCLPPHPAVFIKIEKNRLDLGRSSLPSHPQDLRNFGVGVCDWLERYLWPRWFVSLWCWCVCPPAWAVRATAQPVSILAQ